MKKILIVIAASFMLASCYDSYLREFDYSAAYIAYQFDLRTFVAGEGECFNLPVALAGVRVNEADRYYSVAVEDALCSADLSGFAPEKVAPFTAMDGMLGKAPFGDLAGGSGSYVTTAVTSAGLESLTPLPADYYTVDFNGLCIAKGNVTSYASIKATDKFFDDPKCYGPCYAVAYRITKADVDSLFAHKSYSIVAVKAENKFFGNWYHGGCSLVGGDEVKYPFSIPQDDSRIYTLTTVSKNSVKTNKYAQNAGSLILTFNGDDITVSSEDIEIVSDGRRSYFNGARLLQDRKLYLNYSYLDQQGRTVQVSDSLVFRNRIRDGINEWQDTNVENYQ